MPFNELKTAFSGRY